MALTVFAISALAVSRHINQAADQLSYLENKTFAVWVAENKMAELRSAENWPSLGRTTDTVLLADREWLVATDVSGTTLKGLREVSVSVSLGTRADNSITELIGYVSEY